MMKHAQGLPYMPSLARRTADAFTRSQLALLALSFVDAYTTAQIETFKRVHPRLAYRLTDVGLTRLVRGWLGPRHARSARTWSKLRGWRPWLTGVLTDQSTCRQGQKLFLATLVTVILSEGLGTDLITSNRGRWAVLLLTSVQNFWVWP